MKKMKLVSIFAAFALATSLTACGGAPSSASGASSGASAPSSASQPDESAAAQQTQLWYGQVSSVAGNELTLELAAEPQAPQNENLPKADEDGTIAAVPTTPAAAGTAGEIGAEERQEIELSGETKDFTIPGGLAVKDGSGTEKQLSDIQKGSILTILTNADGLVTEVILHG